MPFPLSPLTLSILVLQKPNLRGGPGSSSKLRGQYPGWRGGGVSRAEHVNDGYVYVQRDLYKTRVMRVPKTQERGSHLVSLLCC